MRQTNATCCYWSVATGPYVDMMERCLASARRSGVAEEFHVLSDRLIEGCRCYDAHRVERADGLFKLIYLKAGMWKLLFDYFVWIDADTWFARNPGNVLGCLGRSPIHVPLTTSLSALADPKPMPGSVRTLVAPPQAAAPGSVSSQTAGLPPAADHCPAGGPTEARCRPTTADYAALMVAAGVYNPVYLSGSSFWVVRRDAIDRVVELATHFRAFAAQRGYAADVSACLGYAMQMLCANPEAHRVRAWPNLWASDEQGRFRGEAPERGPWTLEDRLTGEALSVDPSIVHLHCSLGRERGEKGPAAADGPVSAPVQGAEVEYAAG